MKRPTLKTIVEAIKGFVVNRLPGQPDTWGRLARSGVNITEASMLKSVAVWACVRLISETVASLPLFLYHRMEPRGKEKVVEHSLYPILHTTPNPEMTAFQMRETQMSHLLTWGNSYALKEYDIDRLTIKAVWPLRPDRITVTRDPQTREIIYRYSPVHADPLGVRLEGGLIPIPAWRIWHIPGLSFDGLVGYAPLTLAREAIGLALATEEFGARFFGQGTNVGAVAQHPGKLTSQGHENLRKDLQEKYEGLGKSHTLLLLEEGMTFQKTTIPPNDAQFLETRKFQRSEIASFFHVPPHMIGDLDRATFSNIEEQSLEFVIYTLRPWLVRIEQSIIRSLLNPWERQDYFAEHQLSGLLRGDIESRYRAYSIGRNWGWMSPNDVRELENMNPLSGDDGGDTYLAPANMMPADKFNAAMPQRQRTEPQQ